jgi:ASC-1-like (ASCH) protein
MEIGMDAGKLLTNYSSSHDLKILSCYFDAVKSGCKTFEIRKNSDRGFQKGDIVTFNELKPSHSTGSNLLTGESLTAVITYVINYEQKDDYVVFSFQLVSDKG